MDLAGAEETQPKRPSPIDEGSRFYRRVVPALLVFMGMLMIALILTALCVLLKVVPFQ